MAAGPRRDRKTGARGNTAVVLPWTGALRIFEKAAVVNGLHVHPTGIRKPLRDRSDIESWMFDLLLADIGRIEWSATDDEP